MKFLIIAIFLFAGCISSRPDNANINIAQQVEFQDLDLNEDGDVSVNEVKKFNEMQSSSSNLIESKAPAIITICILSATLLMCLVCAIMKCKKSE